MTFDQLGLSPSLLSAIEEAGYTQPTPIQEKAIPLVLMGRDVLGCAQTGTGKTASFTLPMLDILGESRAKARMPRSLIIAPTRELASQVAESFDKYGKHHKLSQALLIGGTSMSDQEQKLDRGVDVLIATPGRLIDLFERGKILLADVKILVIDEADRMLDMGFIPDVERIAGLLPPLRQTLFFSATMPKEIRKLAERFLHNPKEVSVDPPASAAETVTQRLLRCPGHDKRKALQDLLARDDVTSGLIFCNRKRDVAALDRALRKQGYNAGALHGDMSQPERMETLQRFKDGHLKILVCSDVAARGLDIPAVSHVVNYDVPNNAEDYVHRIGRTGRAGRSGQAVMFATPADAKSLQVIQKTLGKDIPPLDVDSVRQLPPEEVEQSAAATETSPSESEGEGKSKRRRGGRRKKSGGDTVQPAPPQTTSESPAVAEVAAGNDSDSLAYGHVAPEAATPDAAASDASTLEASAPASNVPEADVPENSVAEAAPVRAKPAKGRGKSKAQEAKAPEVKETKSQDSKAQSSKGSGGNKASKKAEDKKQVSNGRQSKPFGDHTPAFLLRPVPESATL